MTTSERPGSSATRRAVSILPWADAEPETPARFRPERPPRRRTPVPPSGLIEPSGFTGPAPGRAAPSGFTPVGPAPDVPVPPRPTRPAGRSKTDVPVRTHSEPIGVLSGTTLRAEPAPAALTAPAAPALPTAPTAPTAPRAPNDSGPTADALRHEWIVRPERETPSLGWRARVYAVTGGRVNPGIGAAERARNELVERIRTPLRGSHQIAVTSIKGGIGKTTVAACLGLVLAGLRGDAVIAVDADPDAGTLADRLIGVPISGVRGLLGDLESISSLSGFGAYTSLAGRLRVLAGDQDPATGEAFRAEEYERICAALARFFDIVVTDSGTGLVHSAMQGTLRVADRLVVVGAPTVDGASRASKTLDWLLAHGHGELAEHAVLVLCRDRISHRVDQEAIRDHFSRRCRFLVEVPADPHLSAGGMIDVERLQPVTRDAFLELAALVADGFSDFRSDHVHGADTATRHTSSSV